MTTTTTRLNSNYGLQRFSVFWLLIVLVSWSSLGHALPVHSTNSKKLAPLLWSSTNRLFTDLTNSGLNYYLKLDAHIGDSIDLVCPKQQLQMPLDFMQASNGAGGAADQAEYSVIYRVGTKHEFDNCIVNPNEAETVPILKCDRPHANNPVMFTLQFVKFSPVPNALEFEEDREYYFLSTSSGAKDGMTYMAGGLCSKFNMRFSIKISSQQPQQQQVQTPQSNNFYNLKENQQQQYNAFNARNNVSLLSHIFTYNRDHESASNNHATDNTDIQTRQPSYESHQLYQLKERERYRLTTKTLSNSLEHDDADGQQLTTQSPQLSNLNLISSATRVPRSSSLAAIMVSTFVLVLLHSLL